MAQRRTPRRDWETALIVGNRLVNRLMKHIMADAQAEKALLARELEHPELIEPGKKPRKSPILTGDQVTATLGLLKKYMPDMKSIELTGNADRPVVSRIERVIVDPKPADPANIPAAADPESL